MRTMRMTLSVARCKRGKGERETVSQAWRSQVAPGHAVPRVDRARTHPDALVILGSDDDRCTLVNLHEQRGGGPGQRVWRAGLTIAPSAHRASARAAGERMGRGDDAPRSRPSRRRGHAPSRASGLGRTWCRARGKVKQLERVGGERGRRGEAGEREEEKLGDEKQGMVLQLEWGRLSWGTQRKAWGDAVSRRAGRRGGEPKSAERVWGDRGTGQAFRSQKVSGEKSGPPLPPRGSSSSDPPCVASRRRFTPTRGLTGVLWCSCPPPESVRLAHT